MGTRRLLLIPSFFFLVFYTHHWVALAGERGARDGILEGVRVQFEAKGTRTVYQVDGLTPHIAADSNEGSVLSPVLSPHPLTFDPPSLDFREQSIGMPQLQVVKVTNPSKTQTLQLTSISGDSADFHPSFFKSKVVKPGDSTTFDVVFLARVLGPVQSVLLIHSSLGTFDYQVQGAGTPNPFRLRPLLGARIPLNATYAPLITMYNPFNTSLQITEMYSSGGELHLELLTGHSQGSKSLWDIRPFESKPIARANFFARAPINHTSFIRIKTSHSSSPSIVLPVEVEVAEMTGLFRSRELLDFGIVKSGESKTLPVFVLNSGPNVVHIKSIKSDNPAIEIEHTTASLKPTPKYVKVASVTFHVDRASEDRIQLGRVVILGEDKVLHRLEVPFEARVMRGSLSYEKTQTFFRVGKPPFLPLIRNISLSNLFGEPLILYDVRLPSKAHEFFTIASFSGPYTLPPRSEERHFPLSIRFLPTSSECLFNTSLRLSTNASLFNIPLHCYDGRITYSLGGVEDVLDYGVLADVDVVSKQFCVHNVNPVRISISQLSISKGLPFTSVELLSVLPTEEADLNSEAPERTVDTGHPPYLVEPGHSAVFCVNVTHPHTLGTFTGEVLIHTSFSRVLHVPVYFKTAAGGLEFVPSKASFDPTFPYGIARLPLIVRSRYSQTVHVTSVQSRPSDPRFHVINDVIHRFPKLKPNALVEVGSMIFDPLLGEGEEVYLGLLEGEGAWSVSCDGDVVDTTADVVQLKRLWGMWSSLMKRGLTFFNLTFVLHTDRGSEMFLPTEASLYYPRLLTPQLLQFPPTAVGNSSSHVLNVSNPSNCPLAIQPVLLHQYSQPGTIVELIGDGIDTQLLALDFSLSQDSFSLQLQSPSQQSAPDGSSSSPGETVLRPLAQTTVLPANSRDFEITVAFTPKFDHLASSLLLIRNNLTIVDFVLLQGRGSVGSFTIDGVQPGSEPLVFDFGGPLLDKCYAGDVLTEPIKTRQVFRMHNSGSSPVTLRMVRVGGGGCEEHGFSILNCKKEITIQQNKSRKLEIIFTPDFTQSRVFNTLRIQTGQGAEFLFPLLATLPHSALAACYSVQPRPHWEQQLVRFSIPFWLVILPLLIVLAFIHTGFGGWSSSNAAPVGSLVPAVQPTGGSTFDLKDISQNIQNERSLMKRSVQTETLTSSDHRLPQVHRPQTTESDSPRPLKHSRHQTTEPDGPRPLKHLSPVARTPVTHSSPLVASERQLPHTTSHPHQSTTPLSTPSQRQQSSGSDSRLRHRNVKQPLVSVSATPQVHHSASSSVPASQTSCLQSKGNGVSAPPTTGKGNGVSAPPTTTDPAGSPSMMPCASVSAAVSSGPEQLESAVTTDNETGMRQPPSEETMATERTIQHVHSPSLTLDPSKATGEVAQKHVQKTDFSSQTSSGDSSPSLPAPRKSKSSRKSSNTKKVSHPSAEPPSPLSSPPLPSPPLPPNIATTAAVKDALERKESESSIRSVDSESTASSSTDKSEEKEEGTSTSSSVGNTATEARVKLRKPPPPLAKEPGTGQTVPLTDAPEDAQIVKKEPTPETQQPPPKRERRESPAVKGKSKKRQRQSLKKEEKLRRREREREREKERERGREIERESVQKKEKEQKDQEKSSSSELIDKDSTSSTNSLETSEEGSFEQEAERANTRPEEGGGGGGKGDGSKLGPSTVTDSPTGEVKLSLTSQNEGANQATLSEELTQPQPSVPGSAICTSRKLSAKQQQFEEILTDPFSRKPDRSTYLSKKAGPQKLGEKGSEVRQLSEEGEGDEGGPDTEQDGDLEPSECPVLITYDAAAENADELEDGAPESGQFESDGVASELSSKAAKTSLSAPTSPHELAASLLSNNPALMRRKLRTDKESGESGEGREEERGGGEDREKDSLSPSQPVSTDEANQRAQKFAKMNHSPPKAAMYPHGQESPGRPTKLSLDAEPFYPSTTFTSKIHSRSSESRQKYNTTLGDYIPTPPSFSSSAEDGAPFTPPQFPQEKRFHMRSRERDQFRQHQKGMSPSPPFHTSAEGFSFMDHPAGPDILEPLPSSASYPSSDPRVYEHAGMRNDPSLMDSSEEGLPQLRGVRDHMTPTGFFPGGAPPWSHHSPNYSSPNRSLSSEEMRQLQWKRQQLLLYRQHQAARAARQAMRSPLTTPEYSHHSSSHYNSGTGRLQLTPEEYKMLVQQHSRHPSMPHHHHRPSRSSLGPMHEFSHRHPQTNLVDDYSPDIGGSLPPLHQTRGGSFDDSYLSEETHSHHLRQQQLHERLMTAREWKERHRTLSGGSDLGGEIVSDLLQSPVTPPVGLNRAPGTAFISSSMDCPPPLSSSSQPRRSSMQDSSAPSQWGTEFTEHSTSSPSSSSAWGGIWSLDSPFSSSKDLGPPGQRPSSDGFTSTTNTTTNQSFTGTYDLFENQSIWSNRSPGVLPWSVGDADKNN